MKARRAPLARNLPAPAPAWSAKAIKRFRQKTLQMSQPEFAALLNLKTPTIRAWEQGHNVPSGSAARLLQAFKSEPALVEKLICPKRFVLTA
jgi:DNA-binding transcriptional regulator YiaG